MAMRCGPFAPTLRTRAEFISCCCCSNRPPRVRKKSAIGHCMNQARIHPGWVECGEQRRCDLDRADLVWFGHCGVCAAMCKLHCVALSRNTRSSACSGSLHRVLCLHVVCMLLCCTCTVHHSCGLDTRMRCWYESPCLLDACFRRTPADMRGACRTGSHACIAESAHAVAAGL